jgi:putative copper export protein
MQTLATFLHHAGVLCYAGPLLAFAALLAVAPRVKAVEPWQLDRAWRAWAPGSGLALGVLILGGVLRYWLLEGSFVWGVAEPGDAVFLAKHIVFLLLWVDYTYTEIWVAEPIRRLDPGPQPPADPVGYAAARRRLVRHLLISATAVVVITVLSCLPV